MWRAAILLVLLLPPFAHANGCPLPCSGQAVSPPDDKLLYVQPDGDEGEVLAYDTATGRIRFVLPAGRTSADGGVHVAASVVKGRTQLLRFDVRTGRRLGAWRVPGRWQLAGVSPSGGRVALARGRTEIAVADLVRRRVLHRLRLAGDFEVETISADGRRLFLIEHLADRYAIRLYDLARSQLVADPLRGDREPALMTGYAWSGIASPEGRWLLTLYLDTSRRSAFVHALDLGRSSPKCIDLPSQGGFDALKRYSLTLSPDGRVLYAANPAVGAVVEIDLPTRTVVHTARFPRVRPRAEARTLGGSISASGRTLYFAGGTTLWAYDTALGRVRGPYGAGGKVVGFGFGKRDRTLHVLRADGRMVTLAAANGRNLRTTARVTGP